MSVLHLQAAAVLIRPVIVDAPGREIQESVGTLLKEMKGMNQVVQSYALSYNPWIRFRVEFRVKSLEYKATIYIGVSKS
jgi:hypothetical protein